MEVKLIDVMGDDLRVVNAARVSFHKESKWEEPSEKNAYSDSLSEQDQKLISYLAKHNHWTPFSHVQITLREKVPIFVARQRFKHMVGFTYNEVSRRYVDDPPEFFSPDSWRKRPEGSVKQGSSNEIVGEVRSTFFELNGDRVYYSEFIDFCERMYTAMIEKGVAPEQARMVLPQSMYTEYYVTGSLAAWARAYKLRIDGHAQKEIQDLARMWQDVIGNIKELEYSWKALTL
jgi:thymidylate synthase (FAD)